MHLAGVSRRRFVTATTSSFRFALGEKGPGLSEAGEQSIVGPGPSRGIRGRRADTSGLLVVWVGDGGSNEEGQISGQGLVAKLELLRRPRTVLAVDLIVHPVAEEQLFLTGQPHPGVRVRHR
jgi:hypothetical protein